MLVVADVTNGVFALLGVLLGSLLASVWAYASERRERRAALYVAAYSCLTRWKKVMSAYKTKPGSVRDEVIRLGRDLDDYMVAIPRVPGRRARPVDAARGLSRQYGTRVQPPRTHVAIRSRPGRAALGSSEST